MPVKEISGSTAVERVAYNAENQRLSIYFKGGRRYIYSGVPSSVYEELCQASSAGKYVCEHMKGHFVHTHPEPRFRSED